MTKSRNGTPVAMVDPIAYFKEEFPVAYELLPGGSASLEPEVSLMVKMAKERGLPVLFDEGCGKTTYVPVSICEQVLETPSLKREDVEAYLADDTTKLPAAVASVGEAA